VAGETLIARFDRVPAADNIRIGVRPEKARFLNGGDTTANALRGRVTEHIYHGTSLRTAVELPDGTEFYVDAMLPFGRARSEAPEIGSDVRIGIEPENVFLFDAEG
jgi:hypothetical protein